MTFGEKLKKLRIENGLTQDELAQKIYVSRTAVSKWETDNGYPSIESLKQLSNLFNVSIDNLISDDDVENKRNIDRKNGRKAYYVAMVFFALTVTFAILFAVTEIIYFNIGITLGFVGYLVFALLSKPKYKRMESKKELVKYIISRAVIFAIAIFVITFSWLE